MSTTATHDGYDITVFEEPDGWAWDIFTEDGCFIRQPEIDFHDAGFATAEEAKAEGMRVARWLSETRL
jgi:hypothetical protein